MNNKKYYISNLLREPLIKNVSTVIIAFGLSGVASADIEIGSTESTSLSMFGILDGGFLYQSKITTEGDEKLGIETSGLRQTVIGFKGSRALDGGLSAFFNLEAHFDLDTGMFHATGDTLTDDSTDADDGSGRLLFRRQANIGLSGDWGTVILGRQYGPALLAHLATEPRVFKEQFSNLYAWAYSQLFTTLNGANSGLGRNTNNDVGIFFKNAIQYRKKVGGLDFGILYSFGGQEGSLKDGDVIALGGAYNVGGFALSASYQNMQDQQTAEDVVTSWSLGAAYSVGSLAVKANFMNTENNDALGNEILDLDALGVGFDWKWSNKNTATIAYYINEDKLPNTSAETKSLVLSNEYTMGDSTTLYAQAAHVDADEGMSVVSQFATSIVANPAPVGEKTTLVNIGVNFAF